MEVNDELRRYGTREYKIRNAGKLKGYIPRLIITCLEP